MSSSDSSSPTPTSPAKPDAPASTTTPPTSPVQTESSARRGCIWFARLLKVAIVLSLLFAMVSMILVLHKYVNTDATFYKKAFLCIYCSGIIAFLLFMALAEFPPKWFSKEMPLLLHIPARGFGLLWMGVQVINVLAQHTDILSKFIDIFTALSGWALVAVGLIYIVAGFCMRYMLPASHGGYGLKAAYEDDTQPEAAPAVVAPKEEENDPFEVSNKTI